jgi:hypothetical protein
VFSFLSSRYNDSVTGLGPETVEFIESQSSSSDYRIVDAKYILRPELIESLFYLHKTTAKQMYVDRSWDIFQSLLRFCKVFGFVSLFFFCFFLCLFR